MFLTPFYHIKALYSDESNSTFSVITPKRSARRSWVPHLMSCQEMLHHTILRFEYPSPVTIPRFLRYIRPYRAYGLLTFLSKRILFWLVIITLLWKPTPPPTPLTLLCNLTLLSLKGKYHSGSWWTARWLFCRRCEYQECWWWDLFVFWLGTLYWLN